jgi:hypothetical protein
MVFCPLWYVLKVKEDTYGKLQAYSDTNKRAKILTNWNWLKKLEIGNP